MTCAALSRVALALVLALAAPCAESEPFAQGLLWRLDKPGVPASWVFGTLHSNDPRVKTLPVPVAHAFSRARTFAMEIYWSETEDKQFYEAMQFDDDRRLVSLVGDEVYSRLQQELGSVALPEEALARTKPWAALLRIATIRGKGDGPTLDRSLFVAARERRMMMLGLEWLDEQVAAFDAIPIETQIALLRHALDHRTELEAQIEPTILAWLDRDLAALASINRAAAGDDPDLRRHYAVLTQQLVSNRSVLMAYRLFLPLKRGRVFVAVGALHLYGTTGLLAQLRAQGYRLRRIY
ncbi:MAG TPA: TraB/GumN family protein [Casimicrobiaceae bacterium]|nr:TraB/GumN family protein [Casimicrobiaceae bacterium]